MACALRDIEAGTTLRCGAACRYTARADGACPCAAVEQPPAEGEVEQVAKEPEAPFPPLGSAVCGATQEPPDGPAPERRVASGAAADRVRSVLPWRFPPRRRGPAPAGPGAFGSAAGSGSSALAGCEIPWYPRVVGAPPLTCPTPFYLHSWPSPPSLGAPSPYEQLVCRLARRGFDDEYWSPSRVQVTGATLTQSLSWNDPRNWEIQNLYDNACRGLCPAGTYYAVGSPTC